MITTLYSSIFITIATVTYFSLNGITDSALLIPISLNSFITSFVIFSKEEKPFTTQKIVNLFLFIFFIIANMQQYSNRVNVLTFNHTLFKDDYIDFQHQLFLILIGFNSLYWLIQLHYNSTKQGSKVTQREESKKVNTKILLYLSAFGCICTVIHFIGNPTLMFVRGLKESLSPTPTFETQTAGLLFSQFVRPISICCLIIGLISRCQIKTMKWLWIFALLSVFPTAVARNFAAMCWLPILILVLDKKLRHNVAMWIMMFAIFVIFPFFNIFRRFNGTMKFQWSMDFFNEIDFDASQLFMAVIDKNWQTNWEQILGPLFFYIPRSWWPDKPIGSGHEFVTQNHGWWNNVSMPYFAEGYVNGGWIGVILFVILLAFICARFDHSYWTKWEPSQSFNLGFYLIFLGALIFIMRGDLLSSTAYTVGVMCCYAACLYLTTNMRLFKIRLK